MAKAKDRPDFEARAKQSQAPPPGAPNSSHLMQWGGGPDPRMSYAPGTKKEKYQAMPTIFPSGEGLVQMEPGMAAAYARQTGEYREFDNPKDAAYYSENGLIDHSPGSDANIAAARTSGQDHPYTTEALMEAGYNERMAGELSRIATRTRAAGLEPFIGPGATGRTQAQAKANKKAGRGSAATKHSVTLPGDAITRFLDDAPTARAADMKFYKMPLREWREKHGKAYAKAVKDKDRKTTLRLEGKLYADDERTRRIYSEAAAAEGWGQPSEDPEMLERSFRKDDWGHIEPLETMQSPRGQYTRPGVSMAHQKLQYKRQTEANDVITAAKGKIAGGMLKDVRQMTETNEYNTEPSPDKVRRLQALADAGYLGVQEYSNPEQKQAVYLPGSGMGGGMLSSGGADVAKVVGEIGKGAKGVLKRTVGVFKGMPGKRGHAETYPQFVGDKPPPGKRNWTTSKSEAEGYAKQYEGDVVKSELPAEALDKMAKGRADLGYDEYLIPESVISPEGVAASKGRPAAASKAQSKLDAFYNQRLKLDRSFKKAREEYIMSLAGEKGWPKGGKGRGK